MSRRVSIRIRLVATSALALGLASAARAQGEGTKAAPAASSPDAIAGAKKEFETIKSARDAALLPNSRMPNAGLPEMAFPTAPSTTVTTKAKKNPSEAKASNWLVDAMEKQSNSTGSRTQDLHSRDRKGRTDSRDRDFEFGNREASPATEKEGNVSRSERERRDERAVDATSEVVLNPLNAFLGDWMTPQDYALLKPGLEAKNDSAALGKASGLPGSLGVTLPGSGLKDLSFGSSVAPANSMPQLPRENPYLQSLKPDTAIATMSSPVKPIEAISVPVAPRPTTMVVPTPVAPPQTKIPEFAKPPSDDRYFKQLKRF